MRLAIAVVAFSFASGVALAALGIFVHRAAGFHDAIVRPAPTASLHSPPTASLRSVPATSISIGDDAEPLSGSAAVELQLTGTNYQWEVRYLGLAGPVLSFGKQQDVAAEAAREIHLPADADVRLRLKSRDFVYLLMIPNLDGGASQKSQIAVPNHLFTLDFNTGPQGTLVLSGDHLCGLPRPSLDLTVVVQSEQEFQAWMNDQRK